MSALGIWKMREFLLNAVDKIPICGLMCANTYRCLSNKQYYATLKYGYARGSEPVTYVDNIQYYTRYLELHRLSLQRELKQCRRAPAQKQLTGKALGPHPLGLKT